MGPISCFLLNQLLLNWRNNLFIEQQTRWNCINGYVGIFFFNLEKYLWLTDGDWSQTNHISVMCLYILTNIWILFCQYDSVSKRTLAALGARYSSMVEHSLMVWWVLRSIPHGPTKPILVPASAGVTKAVCGMVHIKEPSLLIRKSNPCGGSRFLLAIRVVLSYMSDAI